MTKRILRVVVYVMDPREHYWIRHTGVGRTLRAAMRVVTRHATDRRYWVPEPGWCSEEIARGGR